MKFIILKTIIVLGLSLLLSGCTTQSLWEDKSYYDESVQSFNIEGNNLIIIGGEYHYFFKIDDKLKKLLLSKNKEGISFKADSFYINKDNSVNGNVYITYKKDKYEYLTRLGFKQEPNTSTIAIKLKGTRYLPKPNFHFNNNFSKNYKIQFCENWSKYDKSTKILLSPLSITADGVLIVVGISALFVVYEVAVLTGHKPFQ